MFWLAADTVRSSEIPPIHTGNMSPQVSIAITEARSELEENSDAASAWGHMGRLLHAHDLLDGALHCYDEALRRDPDDYRWAYLAAVAVSFEAPLRSIAYFERAADMDPDDHAFFIAFADALLRLGRFEQAQAAYELASELNTRSDYAQVGLARIGLIRGDVDNARILLERVRDRSPRRNDVHTLLAQVYQRLGESAAASRAERLAKVHSRRLQPHSPVVSAMADLAVTARAYSRRGADLARRSDYTAAETAFRQVLNLHDGSPTDFANLAGVLWRLGKRDEALTFFDRGLALDPDHVELLTAKGAAYVDLGQLDRASELLARAIDTDPNFTGAHLGLGRLRFLQRRYALAAGHFGRALLLDPGSYPAYLELSSVYAGNGRLEMAVEALQRLLQIEPENEAGLRELGRVQVRLGEYQHARETLERALTLNPSHVETSMLLTRLLASMPDVAARDAPRALAMALALYRLRTHDPASADLLAVAYAANGEFEKAIRLGERAIGLAEDNPHRKSELQVHLDLYRQGRSVSLPEDGARFY
jgi:tetratricopeptide (TPR) repeat protein|tara:strand:- start:15301 stop:16908 length:1608 start_codon:yes stop_codon:yes gene_type:complete